MYILILVSLFFCFNGGWKSFRKYLYINIYSQYPLPLINENGYGLLLRIRIRIIKLMYVGIYIYVLHICGNKLVFFFHTFRADNISMKIFICYHAFCLRL